MLNVNRKKNLLNQQRFSQLEEVGRTPGRCTSVNDQVEVGLAYSIRWEHELRSTLNTDSIYTYNEVIWSDTKKHRRNNTKSKRWTELHRTMIETDEYRTKHRKRDGEKNGATRVNVKTNTDLSFVHLSQILPLFISTSLKFKGQSLIPESHQAPGKTGILAAA